MYYKRTLKRFVAGIYCAVLFIMNLLVNQTQNLRKNRIDFLKINDNIFDFVEEVKPFISICSAVN